MDTNTFDEAKLARMKECTNAQEVLSLLAEDGFELTDAQLDAADTNGDGVTDISDATRLQEYIAEYPVILGRQTDD